MSIQLSPATDLTFPRPLANGPIVAVTLRNTGTTAVVFKWKTTAPSRYTVRPNHGVVKPDARAEVWIRRNPTTSRDEPRDKFLVQVVAVSAQEVEEELGSVDSMGKPTAFWESVKPSRIVEYKLRTAYAPRVPRPLHSRLMAWVARLCQPSAKDTKRASNKKGEYKLVEQ